MRRGTSGTPVGGDIYSRNTVVIVDRNTSVALCDNASCEEQIVKPLIFRRTLFVRDQPPVLSHPCTHSHFWHYDSGRRGKRRWRSYTCRKELQHFHDVSDMEFRSDYMPSLADPHPQGSGSEDKVGSMSSQLRTRLM